MTIDFSLETKKTKQVIDLTAQVNQYLQEHDIDSGWGKLFVLHTTCCLTTADLDPGTDQDYLHAIDNMFPPGDYQHPHNPDHVGDHIMSSLIGPSVSFPINKGRVQLGTWQKIVLIELNGPRTRNLVLSLE